MMKRSINRVAAIHDLSGFGRASLTVTIPVLSTMGAQVCPVPTAVLSTHTGGFDDYHFIDLTDHMEDYTSHWHRLGVEFDCIYSGFLGSSKQVDIVSRFIDDFSHNNPFVVVDPVLGDNGRLYSTMGEQMVWKMKGLVQKADIITPNYTEAVYLLGQDYKSEVEKEEIKEWLVRLSEMGPKIAIITSVPSAASEKQTSVMAYNRDDGCFWKVSCTYIPAHYPGVGDTFTSVIVGSMLQGDSLPLAMDRGVQFITVAIRASYGLSYPVREGVLLERVLGNLKLPVLVSSYEILE